eukprot:264912_1
MIVIIIIIIIIVNRFHIHTPGNNKQKVKLQSTNNPDELKSMHQVFVMDEYEARMSYAEEQQLCSDAKLKEILKAQETLETVKLGSDPIYLDLCGTLNTEEIELESNRFGKFQAMFDSGAS